MQESFSEKRAGKIISDKEIANIQLHRSDRVLGLKERKRKIGTAETGAVHRRQQQFDTHKKSWQLTAQSISDSSVLDADRKATPQADLLHSSPQYQE